MIQAHLSKDEYIQFLKVCKKKKLTKYQVTKLAVLAFCNIKSTQKKKSLSIDEELKELEKEK